MCVRLAMVASALALVAGLALPAFAQDEKTPAWAQVLPKDGQVLVTWAAVKDATGYTVSRRMVGEEIDKAKAVNAAPVKETSLVDQGLTNGTSYIYSVVASFADGSKGDPKEAVGTPQAAITLAGKPFQSYDVETLNPGSAKVDGNVLTIQGAGADIWDAADGHTFLATPVSGDFTFTIKLNEKPVIANDGTFARGETPIIVQWDYLALADRDVFAGNPNTEIVIPTTGVFAGIYIQGISAYAPHPNAAKLWMEHLYSDEGQLIWLKGYCHPIRYNDLAARGVIPADIAAKLPSADLYAQAVFPSLDQLSAARELITTQWDSVVGADVQAAP
jgi:hypothetical protein